MCSRRRICGMLWEKLRWKWAHGIIWTLALLSDWMVCISFGWNFEMWLIFFPNTSWKLAFDSPLNLGEKADLTLSFFPGKFFVIMKSNRILCPLNSNPWECKLTVFLLWLIGFEYSNCIVGRVTNEPQLDHWSPAAIDEHKRQNGKAEHRE